MKAVLRPWMATAIVAMIGISSGAVLTEALVTSPPVFADVHKGVIWSHALAVPGMAALSPGGAVTIDSISCAVAGNCSAGGYYQLRPFGPRRHRFNFTEPFVVSEENGIWGRAIAVRGAAKLNAGVAGRVESVSCGALGNCSAGGYLYENQNQYLAFISDEVDGSWEPAIKVRTSTSMGPVASIGINAISCTAAGNCSAGGMYLDTSSSWQAFVVNEVNGTWGEAIEVPGTASLNVGGFAEVIALSCASAGNCSAGGSYWGQHRGNHAFVVNETSGSWGKASEVPGFARLNVGGEGEVDAVSCSSAGDCSAGGSYTGRAKIQHAFVVSEANGAWGTAFSIPAEFSTSTSGSSANLMACASNGSCSAGGYRTVGTKYVQHSFLLTERHGEWVEASVAPGGVVLNSISCWSAGNCMAGGETSGSTAAVTVVETNGRWGHESVVAGFAAPGAQPSASIDAISCPSADGCAAAGGYFDRAGFSRAFLLDEVK